MRDQDADRRPSPAPGWWRELGTTGLEVAAVSAGTSGIGRAAAEAHRTDPGEITGAADSADAGDLADTAGAAQDLATVRALLDSPITSIDTSNGYADGWSERRIGEALRAAGGLPSGRLVMTKVDPRDGDFSGARVRASVEESLERLGVDRLPLLHLHDPDHFPFEDVTVAGGAVDTLVALREEGLVDAVGLAGGRVAEITRYLRLGVFDVLLVHNRLTLVDRSAEELVAEAVDRGTGVINAAVYGGGILAGRPGERTTYAYRPAPPELLDVVERMRHVCADHGTDLATAALHFSLRDPRVATTVVGMSRPERVGTTVDAATRTLPDDLFAELEELVPPRELWIEHRPD